MDSACSDMAASIDERSQVEESHTPGLLERDWQQIWFRDVCMLEHQSSTLQKDVDEIGWVSEVMASLGAMVDNISARHKSTLKAETWGSLSVKICNRLIRGETPSAEHARGRLQEILDQVPKLMKRLNASAGFRALFGFEREGFKYNCCLLLVAKEQKGESISVEYGLFGMNWKLEDDSAVEDAVFQTDRCIDARVDKDPLDLLRSSEMLQIQVITLGGKPVTVLVDSAAAVSSLKLALVRETGVSVVQQRLLLGEEVVEDDALVSNIHGIVTMVHQTPQCTECNGDGVCRACGGHKLWQWKDQYERTKAKKFYEFTKHDKMKDFRREGYVYGCGHCGGSGSNCSDSGECDIVFGSGKCWKCSGTGYWSVEVCYEEQRKKEHCREELKCQKRKRAFQSLLTNGALRRFLRHGRQEEHAAVDTTYVLSGAAIVDRVCSPRPVLSEVILAHTLQVFLDRDKFFRPYLYFSETWERRDDGTSFFWIRWRPVMRPAVYDFLQHQAEVAVTGCPTFSAEYPLLAPVREGRAP